MKNTATITAISPFLSVQQAADELGTTPLNVKRLVARGSMSADFTGIGELRVKPEQIARYVTRGNPDFTMPEVRQGKFAPDRNDGFAARYESELREMIGKAVDQITELPRDKKGRPIQSVDVSSVREVQDYAASGPLQSVINFAGETPATPPANRSIQFAVAKVRQLGFAIANRELKTSDAVSGLDALGKLYASPDEYRRICDLAWEQFQNSAVFAVRKTFNMDNRAFTVTWSMDAKKLPVAKPEILKEAF